MGCRFEGPTSGAYDPSPLGHDPRQSAYFVNIEADRKCATPEEEAMGIDIARPYEEGFWVGKSSKFGLDTSSAALSACGGHPQRVTFQGSFPEGNPICANAAEVFGIEPGVGNIPGTFFGNFTNTTEAVKGWCYDQGLVDMDGNSYWCSNVAWPAAGSTAPIPSACTDAGSLRADFTDLRKIQAKPIVWQNLINVAVVGNELRKTSVGLGNAGAAGNTLLAGGDGFMEFTIKDIGPERVAGFATYGLPDIDPSSADIAFGIHVRQNGSFAVVESGMVKFSLPDMLKAGARFRITVQAGTFVQYYLNNQLFYTSAIGASYPMHVSVALKELGASLTNVTTSF